MAIRIVGKGMKLVMSGKNVGVVVIDGDGLEVSFTPAAIRMLSRKFKEYEWARLEEDAKRFGWEAEGIEP